MAGTDYFNVTALFICFREVLEASVIVAVLLQFMEKTKNPQLKKQVWIGASLGILASIMLGVAFVVAYYAAKASLYNGNTQYYFEGVFSLLAALLVTLLAFAMLKVVSFEKKFKEKLDRVVTDALSGKKKYAVASAAFTAVFREGVETVVFVGGVTGSSSTWKAIPIPSIIGIILGVAAGFVMYFSSHRINLRWLFISITVVLCFLSAGMVMYGIHEFQEGNVFGQWRPAKYRNWWNQKLWDIKACCNHGKPGFFAVARALVGYTDQPTRIEIICYFGYWTLVLVLGCYNWWKTKKQMARTAEKLDLEEANKEGLEHVETEGKDVESGQDGAGDRTEKDGLEREVSDGKVISITTTKRHDGEVYSFSIVSESTKEIGELIEEDKFTNMAPSQAPQLPSLVADSAEDDKKYAPAA